MKYLIMFNLLVLGGLASALEPLRVDNPKTVGRFTFFQADGEYSYILPSGFSTKLECDSMGQKTECLLYLYNYITKEEQTQINAIGPAIAISPLLSVVTSVDEGIKSNFTDINLNKIKFLKSLVLSPAPYAMTRFVVAKERGVELQNIYKTTGFGTYNEKIGLSVSDTSFYLAIKSSIELKNKLLDLDGKGIRTWGLKAAIKEVLKDISISSKGYTDSERDTLAAEKVMDRFFKKTGFATYQVKTDVVRNIGSDAIVFVDDTKSGLPYQCEVSLEIKDGAKPITKCSEVE